MSPLSRIPEKYWTDEYREIRMLWRKVGAMEHTVTMPQLNTIFALASDETKYFLARAWLTSYIINYSEMPEYTLMKTWWEHNKQYA